MKNVIITNATWSGDEKSVDFTIYDAGKVGVKENEKRLTVEVGANNWEEENEEECRTLISAFLKKEGLIAVNTISDYSIE